MARFSMIPSFSTTTAEVPRVANRLERPLIHEVLFHSLGIIMIVRLLLAGSTTLALLAYGAPLVIYTLLVIQGCIVASNPASTQWQRVRLLYPFVLMNLFYQATRPAILALGSPTHDAWIVKSDRWIFGGDLGVMLDQHWGWIYNLLASEIFSLCYSLFFLYLVSGIIRSTRGSLDRQMAFSTGLWSLYAIGLLGYTLVPAYGPFVSFRGAYHHEIAGWFFTNLNHTIVTNGSSTFDAFPSLHAGVSLFLLLWDWHTARRWFWACLLPVVLLWISTIYLLYHYGTDLIAGALLALGCLALAFRNLKTHERHLV
jgi:membrane-associated phospholipid phosphatase